MSNNYLTDPTFAENSLLPQFSGYSGVPLSQPRTIAFVDAGISDSMTVMASLRADIKIILDPTRNGVDQITETLAQYQGLSGVEIVSHGNVANLQLGNSSLSASSLAQYADRLQQWKLALASDADILFYGCNVAAGELGRAFINDISRLTDGDVAASIDLTGDSLQGGDWDLEYQTGNIETAAVEDRLKAAYDGVLISINAGGGTYTDGSGQVWDADQQFSGGYSYTTTAAIDNTTSDPLFQNERTGVNFNYAIAVANGTYQVNLGMAEIYWNAANSRIFSVTGEGQSLLSNYDLWTDAGGKNKAVVKTFNINVTDGILNLNFAASKDQAKVDFIQVNPLAPTPGITPVQSDGSTAVAEGGVTDTYSLVLNTQPTADVTVTLNTGSQLTTNTTTLTFTSANWNVAQSVTVSAVDDTGVEGNHTGTIFHTVSSSDSNYNGLILDPITVAVTDNDSVPGLIAINAGGGAYIDDLGQVWSADQQFSGGYSYTTTAAIDNTTNDPLFQNERTGASFNYAIAVANGSYEVDLGMAEIYWNAANSRIFSVTGEGQSLLSNYDLWSDAGGKDKAVVKKFTVNVTDGILNLGFSASKDQAKVDFIKITPVGSAPGINPVQSGGNTVVTEGGANDSYSLVLNTQPTANVTVTLNGGTQLSTSATTLTFTPANWNVAQVVTVTAVNDTLSEGDHTGTISHTVSSSDANYNGLTIAPISVAITDNDVLPGTIAINAGGGAYTDGSGQVWVTDQQFTGGGTYSTTAPIDNTTSDILFQNERTGTNFSYAIAVANGSYEVDLGMAEIYWNGANSRIFSVTGEGQSLLSNYDLWSDAGGKNKAVVKKFTVNVTDGILNLNFSASKDQAKVDFIKVIPVGSAPDATLTQSGGNTAVTESGTTDTYSVVLNTQPTADVIVTLNGGTQLTTSATTLTFTAANWNVAQVVTVTAVDDAVAEGNHTGSIFHTVTSSDANYNGLAIAPLTVAIADNDSTPTSTHINVGGGTYVTDETYVADQYFTGGNLYGTGAAIAGTTDDALYQTERYGATFTYAIPVVNGTYNIDLGFAEIYFDAAGERIFDVNVEGQLAIDDLDIWSQVGKNAALTKLVSGIVVTDGFLNITLTASKDNAKLSFLAIHPYTPDSTDPFLHVVIDAPTFVVDYNGNGTEIVSLFGNQSHTHEFGHSLTSFNWKTGSTVLGTTIDLNTVLGLGQNNISLTIGDDNTVPRTLTGSTNIGVYSLNAVGGVLTKYYSTFSSYFPTLLDALPTTPGFVEILPSLKINEDSTTGEVGRSPYNGDVIAVMTGKYQATTTGSYDFQVNGASDQRIFINGALVTGAINLTAGTKYDIEVRAARAATITAPLEVLAAVNGGTATAISATSLTNDQTALKPFINGMPNGGSGLGGQVVTIKGVAFFEGDTANLVKVNWGNTVLTGAALTIQQGMITFVAPAGTGTIAVSVETPNGVSDALNYTYTAGSVPINFTPPQVVANMAAPTQGTWGPDGRFYVGSVTGTINAYTFDDNYNVVATQTINALAGLPNNNILGIAFSPYDVTGQPKIYVAHSQLFANGGADIPAGSFSPYSGQVSVLSGPNFTTVNPLITGLPVSNHDHGINGMAFDDSGNLLIAVGGNTNAGIPSTPLGALPESPFSGAILKATITNPTFNGTINYIDSGTGVVNNNQVFGGNVDVQPGVNLSVYASGLRNPFDLVWTTNSLLYGTDNGPNAGFGASSTSPTGQGADPNNPDELNLILPGVYYGHPNRNRGRYDPIQNIYNGPTVPSVAGTYMAPLATIAPSTNGLDEYRATTFNGQLRGHLLAQKWNGALYNFALSADGMQVNTTTLPNNPTGLDIVAGPGGALVSVDYQDNYITVSKPIDAAATGVTAYDIFPWRAPAAGGGNFVIGGANFGNLANTTVTIGGQTAILTGVSGNRIRGTLPTNAAGASGLLDIVITSNGQTSVIPGGFKYLA
jgi:hypothetical protein